jgi:DNA-binding NarL/FixJ family response regulator
LVRATAGIRGARSGLGTGARRGSWSDPPAVVVLTTFDGDDHVQRAMRAGAAGYLLKSTPPEDLVGQVKVAAAGHTVLSRSEARGLVGTSGGSCEARTRLDVLTDRERDVVALLGEGRSNAEIAGTLYLTEAR